MAAVSLGEGTVLVWPTVYYGGTSELPGCVMAAIITIIIIIITIIKERNLLLK
jgi:hypothetical protein